jgi:hypothetical protein
LGDTGPDGQSLGERHAQDPELVATGAEPLLEETDDELAEELEV